MFKLSATVAKLAMRRGMMMMMVMKMMMMMKKGYCVSGSPALIYMSSALVKTA